MEPDLDRVVVVVRDRGPGFNIRKIRQRPLSMGESGRGVRLIDSLVDRVDYRHRFRTHSVRLLKRSRCDLALA